jgi:hypothetical protein
MNRRIAGMIAVAVSVVVVQIGPFARAITDADWSVTGSMSQGRWVHTATLLGDGKVLAAGGDDSCCGPATATAELYDPAAGTWTPTGSMVTPRSYYTATLLHDGRVLVAGGRLAGTEAISSAELYDPIAARWIPTGSMNSARWSQTATLLTDGKVLVAGGYDGSGDLSSSELYDPLTGLWTPTGSMNAAAHEATATLLSSGRILVAGGLNSTSPGLAAYERAEIYDPATGVWSPTGSMGARRRSQTATLLPNGKVLVMGGIQSGYFGYLASAELYDPVAGAWSPTGSMTQVRERPSATLLPGGKVLVAGGAGADASRAELYDAGAGVWSPTVSMHFARQRHTATLLLNGRVLVTGGGSGNVFSSAELYRIVELTDTGRAYGIGLTAPGLGTLTVADTGPVSTTSPGTTRAKPKHLSVANPIVSVMLLDARVVATTTSAASATVGQALVNIVPGMPIIVRAARAESAASCNGANGKTTIGFIQIGTVKMLNVAPKPNKTVSLGDVTLVLNEQTPITNGIRVNAVHLFDAALGVDLVISSAESAIEGCS